MLSRQGMLDPRGLPRVSRDRVCRWRSSRIANVYFHRAATAPPVETSEEKQQAVLQRWDNFENAVHEHRASPG